MRPSSSEFTAYAPMVLPGWHLYASTQSNPHLMKVQVVYVEHTSKRLLMSMDS